MILVPTLNAFILIPTSNCVIRESHARITTNPYRHKLDVFYVNRRSRIHQYRPQLLQVSQHPTATPDVNDVMQRVVDNALPNSDIYVLGASARSVNILPLPKAMLPHPAT